jgi:hypothetical protein
MNDGDKLRAPEGFALFGWWRSNGGIQAQVRESQVHLVRAGDPKDRRLVCGRRSPTRGASIERTPTFTVGYSDERGVCERCFVVALTETTHAPAHHSENGGIPWGARRPTKLWQLGCACGKAARLNEDKRGVEQAHREHVRAVLYDGVFGMEQAGSGAEKSIGTVGDVAQRCGLTTTTKVRALLDELRLGGVPLVLPHVARADIRVRVTRFEEPWLPAKGGA